jgi:iron complex outermembrane receptor protein
MRIALLTGTAMALAASTSCYAQAAPEGATGAGQGLSEIIVTAQRQKESLQRAAIAVDVMQGADLIAAGVTQIERINQLTPALATSNGGTGTIMFVRGVGNFTVSPNSDPAVAFGYDGVYVGRPSSTSGLFYDLERVEVLKGPQGTLYGRNATGGAINVLPTQPKLGLFGGYATASYGSYGTKTLEGAVNVPLGADGALRASGSVSRHDGYLSDGSYDEKTSAARLQMKTMPAPGLTIRVSGDFAHSGGVGFSATYLGNYVYNPAQGRYNLAASGLPSSEGFYTLAAQAYRATVIAGTAGRTLDALAPYPYQNNSFYGAHAEVSYDTGAGVLTVLPAWRYAALDYLTGAAGFIYKEREKDEQYSLEARFAGKRIGMFDYTIGGYYFDERIDANTRLTLSSALSLLDPVYRTRSAAAFGRVTAHLSERLRLVGGARYSHDRKTFVGPTTAAALICLSPVGCPGAPLFPLVNSPANLPFNFPATPGTALQLVNGIPTGVLVARTDRNDNSGLSSGHATWRAAVEYDVAPHSLLYASYETGYRSGGFSAAAGFETYQPEYIDAATIGMKNRFFGNRLQLNLEGFYWKYKDQQVNHVGLDLTGRTANFTQNIGRSRMWGGEVEARALITRTTLISADIQYLNTKDLSFNYQQAVGAPGTPPPLTGCRVSISSNPALYDINCAGMPAYNSPKWTMNIAAQQTIPLDRYNVVIGIDTQFKTRRAVGFEYLPEEFVGSSWQTNAQISFGPADDRWSISAFVRNIENDRTLVGTGLHPTANILTVQTTQPRVFGGRISVKF